MNFQGVKRNNDSYSRYLNSFDTRQSKPFAENKPNQLKWHTQDTQNNKKKRFFFDKFNKYYISMQSVRCSMQQQREQRERERDPNAAVKQVKYHLYLCVFMKYIKESMSSIWLFIGVLLLWSLIILNLIFFFFLLAFLCDSFSDHFIRNIIYSALNEVYTSALYGICSCELCRILYIFFYTQSFEYILFFCLRFYMFVLLLIHSVIE